MKHRYRLAIWVFAVCLVFFSAVSYSQDKFKVRLPAEGGQGGDFKLKLGAKGPVCLSCHVNFQEKMKSPFVHTPAKTGDCTGCHNPHASSHGKLLEADPNKVCFRCHSGIIPEKAQSTHAVVVKGNCVGCHDPHGSNNRFNLLKAGNALCFDCHKKMGETIAQVKFRHAPVEKGCTSCHNPHASQKAQSLLLESVPALCKNCHKTDAPAFAKQHVNYPVANTVCTSCHNPHGSDRGGILFNNVHNPVAGKMCNQCHEEPTSETPFATKRPGYELCRGCHNTTMNEILGKNIMHWPVVSKKGCLTCHNPHASTETKLLKGPMIGLCGKCHDDTIERQKRAITKHPPIAEGSCTTCHQPHSSDNDFLLSQSSVVELCGTCHEWMKHSTHPIGEKIRDPRNKNLYLQCLSCHRSHGTEYKNFIYYPVVSELCTQCHVKFKR